MSSKRLYLSVTERKLAGVCGGLAKYFECDPTIMRLIFVIVAFFGGGGILIYLILWIITPKDPTGA